eukprot:scaffold4794_cov115-Skeletonema_dohrnii-CCMP3373.AAC.2
MKELTLYVYPFLDYLPSGWYSSRAIWKKAKCRVPSTSQRGEARSDFLRHFNCIRCDISTIPVNVITSCISQCVIDEANFLLIYCLHRLAHG